MIPEEPLLPDVETWALHAPAPVAPLPCLRLTVHRASVVAGGMSLALVVFLVGLCETSGREGGERGYAIPFVPQLNPKSLRFRSRLYQSRSLQVNINFSTGYKQGFPH